MSTNDTSLKLCRSFGRIRRNSIKLGSGDTSYLDGEVVTAHGIVSVYSEEALTTLQFAKCGRLYMRSIQKGYGMRYLVTLATRFALEAHKEGR